MGISISTSKDPGKIISEAAFSFWNTKSFRALLQFDKIEQVEQDRMFNELEVTGLGLAALYSVQLKDLAVQNEVVNSFMKIMKDLPIEKKYITGWEKLIELRFKEYRENYPLALKASENWREFKGDFRLQRVWARIETLAIDGWTHIRRGKCEEGDPLWREIRKWLVILDIQLITALNLSELLSRQAMRIEYEIKILTKEAQELEKK